MTKKVRHPNGARRSFQREPAVYKAEWYGSPIDLPVATSGKAEIRHRIIPVGERTPVVGMRQAILRGTGASTAVLSEPLLVHELVHEDHGMWMTDLPEELNQIEELLFAVKPKGRVLVGGLGLGILAQRVIDQDDVSDVTVVELDADVIKLCAKPGYNVVHADIMEYLRTSDEQFDYYLLDTWQGTGETVWWEEVMPMRRLIRKRWGVRAVVHSWAEDIMQGQIFRALTTCPPHWYTTHLPVPMTEEVAREFLWKVGWPSWECLYGESIDKGLQE